MEKAINDILNVLQSRGYRVTGPRVAVITTLHAASQPSTIQELAQNSGVEATSAYRTVEMLKREGLLEEIAATEGAVRYALAHEHHHHVVCTNCGFVAHVPCSEPHTPRNTGFASIDGHEVTHYGTCATCAQRVLYCRHANRTPFTTYHIVSRSRVGNCTVGVSRIAGINSSRSHSNS